jgi:hypothetical protein
MNPGNEKADSIPIAAPKPAALEITRDIDDDNALVAAVGPSTTEPAGYGAASATSGEPRVLKPAPLFGASQGRPGASMRKEKLMRTHP